MPTPSTVDVISRAQTRSLLASIADAALDLRLRIRDSRRYIEQSYEILRANRLPQMLDVSIYAPFAAYVAQHPETSDGMSAGRIAWVAAAARALSCRLESRGTAPASDTTSPAVFACADHSTCQACSGHGLARAVECRGNVRTVSYECAECRHRWSASDPLPPVTWRSISADGLEPHAPVEA